MIDTEIFSRQTGLIDPQLLGKNIGIVGAGSIGSWSTLALLKMGCQNVKVYDFDSVSPANIGSQIYTEGDIGLSKLEALTNKMRLLTQMRVDIQNTRVTPTSIPDDLLSKDMIILAVDNIEARKFVFDAIPDNWTGTLIDARMAGNALEIYTIPCSDPARVEYYKTTLFEPRQARPIACSMRSVVYNVFIVGGLVADIVAKVSKGETPPKELIMDLANFTLYGGLEHD
jgi:hypothetical protein